MGNQRKSYSGSIISEKEAARVYDKLAIKNLGLRAKTNFDYRRKDILKIIDEIEENEEPFRIKKTSYLV